ncbi:MAG: MMPL family transporter, partial [Pseudomonas stutzeri]|nr:MMPL family transporter [Stutzerimonas stutzeri]
TSLAFLAFTPTDFAGMAQLGIIAAGGVVIAFIASLTLLPAVLALVPMPTKWRWAPRSAMADFRAGDAAHSPVRRIAALAIAALALGSAFVVTSARF